MRCLPGWFNATLPAALATLPPAGPDRRVLVHIDADLHASALYCLTTLGIALGRFADRLRLAFEGRGITFADDGQGLCWSSEGQP